MANYAIFTGKSGDQTVSEADEADDEEDATTSLSAAACGFANQRHPKNQRIKKSRVEEGGGEPSSGSTLDARYLSIPRSPVNWNFYL